MLNVTDVIVVPTYNEELALPAFLNELTPKLKDSTAIIISDDSTLPKFEELKSAIKRLMLDETRIFIYSHHVGKGGRGAAVKRGFALALSEFPNLQFLVECDADGSHQPSDVLKIMNFDKDIDMLIGSRYLKESKISNWPASRRFFSKMLNLVVPRILGLKVHDITNGLRRYSKDCAKKIVNTDSINTGFIYLSEQALIANKSGFSISETPIHFINRTLGKSTVTYKEIFQSISGIAKIVSLKDPKK